MCEIAEQKMAELASNLAIDISSPVLLKGRAGIIGVVGGGSIDNTGAPYFSSYTSLRVGADVVFVFSTLETAPIIKIHNPDLKVLPLLSGPVENIEPFLDRLHVIVIGPGLGTDSFAFNVIERIIELCRTKKKPMVIDGDGLNLLELHPNLLKGYSAPVVLTPNVEEFCNMIGIERSCRASCGDELKLRKTEQFVNKLGSNIIILCKGPEDDIIVNGKMMKITGGGSPRRCGNQGDFLSGALSTFLHWAILKEVEPAVACYAAAKLTRHCSERAFAKFGRSMTTSDMFGEIHGVFEDYYELK